MLKGKQKSYLRSLAQTLKPVFQIGKEGMNQAVFQSVYDFLFKNELGKISILDSCPQTKEEVASFFEQRQIEVVQVIGKTLVLYLPNKNLENRIRLPR